MTWLLKLSLVALFAGMSFIVFTQSADAEKYIRVRYGGMRSFLHGVFPSINLPKDLLSGLSRDFFIFLSAFFFVGAIVILLHRTIFIRLYAYLILTVGGMLHIPYDATSAVSQLRKLLFTVAIFFCMFTLASCSSNEGVKEKVDASAGEDSKKRE